MTHIDPFAPGDSPQHPANFGKQSEELVPMESEEVIRYRELLAQFGTPEEKLLALDENLDSLVDAGGQLPTIEELEERAEDGSVYVLRLSLFGTEEERARDDWSFWELHDRFDFGHAPAASAVKAEWQTYAERVARVRGEDIPRNEQGEVGTIAQLQDYTSNAVNDTATRVADAAGQE